MTRKLPGLSWRFKAWHRCEDGDPIRLASTDFDGPTEFDELVVGDWLHLEQMDHRDWWCRFGPLTLNIRIRGDGLYDLTIEDEAEEVVARWQAGKQTA